MLATRQKIQAINRVIRELLEEGIYPTLYEVFNRLAKVRRNPWGSPQSKLRPAYPNQPIGGSDGRDIERTFADIREDLVTWYNELVGAADNSLANYWMFEGKREILKRRILHLIQASESQITSSARGGATVLKDTFNSASLVDFSKTTAELNLDSGFVTLPTSLNALTAMPMAGAVVLDEKYPANKPHGKITDALTDSGNTGWYASLDGGTYSVTVKLPEPGTANGFYINPMGPLNLVMSYSNDGYNFYPVVSESIRQEKSWSFKEDQVIAIKLEITGKEVGIKRLKVLHTSFAERARFESVNLDAKDLFGNSVPIHSLRLEVEEECAPGTDIEYWVKPIYPISTQTQAWRKLGDSTIWFSPSSPQILALAGPANVSLFQNESPEDNSSRFYIRGVGADPVLETSTLTKGGDPTGGDLGQMLVEYAEHSWAPLLEPNHSPIPSDWEGFGATTKTYWRPLSLYGTTTQPDPLQQEAAVLASNGCPVVEATTISDGSEINRDWLVIGVKDSDWLLAPGGNYRLSFYVYMPEDTVVSDKPCLLYNPGTKGGSGRPIIAPFRIYLNGELVADERRSWSGDMAGADLSQFNVTYAYKAGWNRFEVLIYNKGPQSEDLADDEILASGCIGIYIAGNPYNLARFVPGRKVQAHNAPETRVSEFALRHLVMPNDNTYWAWTDTAPRRNIILNYDPRVSSYDTFDGYNFEQSPVLTLFYYDQSAERPTAVKFAADFTREPDAAGVPKLHLYKLILNQTGG